MVGIVEVQSGVACDARKEGTGRQAVIAGHFAGDIPDLAAVRDGSRDGGVSDFCRGPDWKGSADDFRGEPRFRRAGRMGGLELGETLMETGVAGCPSRWNGVMRESDGDGGGGTVRGGVIGTASEKR
jgi:hypothetical protein